MGFALRKEYQPLHWWLLYICTFLLLSVCLFTTPVTAGSSTSLQMAVPRSGMLIPLYIYPTPGAWDPLYSASVHSPDTLRIPLFSYTFLICARIKSHPSVDFIVVINPASGPGAFPLPDSIYTQEITKLNTYANVRTIGYVPMGYGRTPIEKTYADIAKYVGWGDRNPNIAMQGIFLDESPQVSDGYNTTYVDNVRKYVKSQKGLSGGLLGKWNLLCLLCTSMPRSKVCSGAFKIRPLGGLIYGRKS